MAVQLKNAVFETHMHTSGTDAPRDQAEEAYRRIGESTHRIGSLPGWLLSSVCRYGDTFRALGACTYVLGGIGIKLGNRPFFGWLFDIVDVVANDLLRLRVINHDRFRTRRILFTHRIDRDVARLPVPGLARGWRILVGKACAFFGISTLAFSCLVFRYDISRDP